MPTAQITLGTGLPPASGETALLRLLLLLRLGFVTFLLNDLHDLVGFDLRVVVGHDG